MAKKEKEPLYKVVSYWVIGIGIVISAITVICMVISALGPMAKALVGTIDVDTMHALNRQVDTQYGKYYTFGISAWWGGIMLAFVIQTIGDLWSRFFATS